jgi:hypothetical protein
VIDNEQPYPGNEDHNYENIDEDEIADRRSSFRVVIVVVSAIIALVMVALPVVRVIDWGDDDDDANVSASEARAFVANRFARDAFARLSPTAASQWALPELREEIEAIVGDLRQHPTADLRGAAVSVAEVDCGEATEPDIECFHAWVRQPGATDLIRVKLTVSIINGNARVIAIERVNVV